MGRAQHTAAQEQDMSGHLNSAAQPCTAAVYNWYRVLPTAKLPYSRFLIPDIPSFPPLPLPSFRFYMDGGVAAFIPRPPTEYTVKVCCFPVNEVLATVQVRREGQTVGAPAARPLLKTVLAALACLLLRRPPPPPCALTPAPCPTTPGPRCSVHTTACQSYVWPPPMYPLTTAQMSSTTRASRPFPHERPSLPPPPPYHYHRFALLELCHPPPPPQDRVAQYERVASLLDVAISPDAYEPWPYHYPQVRGREGEGVAAEGELRQPAQG